MDIAGIDVLGHVARNLAERLPTTPTRRRSRCRRSSSADRARLARREDRPGLLQAAKTRPAAEILTLDPATLDVPAEAAGAPRRRSTRRAVDRRRRRAHQDAVPRQGQGRRVPARDARRRRCSTPRASRPRSPTRSTTSIARCGGASAGSSVRSRLWTRSASEVSPPIAARHDRCRRSSPSCSSRAQPLPRRLRAAGRAGSAAPASRRRNGSASSRRTPAPAWSISATACSRSSSTRR